MSFGTSKRFPEPKEMAPPVGYYNPSVPAVLPGPVTFGKAVSKENINDVPPPGHYELDPPIIRVKRSASLGRKSTSRTANQTVFERHSSCSSLISESQATPAGVQPKKLEFRPPLGSKLPVMKRNFRSSTTVNSQAKSSTEEELDSLKSEKALLSAQLQKAEVHEQLFSDQLRQYVDLFHKIQEQNNFYTAMCFSDSQRLTEFQMRCGDDIRSVQENLVEARKFIQDLHNLNQEAEAENCRNKEKITRLQEALNLTSTEFGEIKNQLYSAENREVSLQKELAASRNEVEKLRHDLKSTETDNQSLLDNIRSLGDLNAKLTKGMEKLEEKMASMEKGERDLVVQLKNELKASNEKADANFRKLQSAVMSKQTEIDRLRSQLHESDQEKLANTERASEISEKLKLTLNELAAAGQQLLSQEDLIKSLKEQLDSFWNENEQLSRELKDLSCQSLLLATESQQMAMKLEEMRAAVVQMEKTDDKTITELKGQLSATIEESETKVKKAEDQVISLNDKLQEIQNKTDDYRRSHEALQLENFCLKSSIEEQTEKIKQLSEEKQQQDSEIAQLKTNLEMTSNLLVETQQKLSSEQNAADSLNKRMEFTGKEIEQLRHQLESVSNENQMVKAEKLELLENFNSLQVTVSKSEKSKKLLQAHVDDINQKLINACAELKDRIVLADLLKTQLDAAQCASQQLHKEMELAQSECFMLKASIIKLQASQQQVEAQINQKTAEILRSVESLEIAAANLAEAQRLFQSQEVYIAEMKRKSESDDKKIESLMKAVQSLELERQNLVAFGAKQAEEIQKWCKSSEHLNMALRSLQDLEQQNCGEIEKLSKERQNALDMVAQLDAKVVTLESSLESVTVQLQMTQIAEENFRLDIENARAEVAMVKELGESLQSQKDAEIRMLQERLALADAEIANGKNDRAKYEELESLLRSVTADRDHLKELIGPFEEQLRQFRAENRDLQSKEEESEAQLKKLFDRYSEVLGHHNNKQRIKHVMQLKEELLVLRKEVPKLKEENTSLRRSLAMVRGDGKQRLEELAKPKSGGLKENNQTRPV